MTKIRWALACCGIWGLCSLVFVSANVSVGEETISVEDSFSVLTLLDTTSSGHAKKTNANDTATKNEGEKEVETHQQQELIDWNVQTLLYYLGNLHIQQQKQKHNLPAPAPSSSSPPSLSASVVEQVRAYVSSIASMYRPQNYFHNFEHATQVTRAMHYLLSSLNDQSSAHLQPHIQTIQQDPLMQVALVIVALVHDLDHSGVPNTQRILEEPHLVLENNNNQSIAERHSLHVAWHLLQRHEFDDFRGLLFHDEQPHNQFYDWIETAIMATDIADAGLRTDRQRRWDITFGSARTATNSMNIHDNNMDAKVTIAIEHMMQIADIAHTMHIGNENDNDINTPTTDIFRKWNERLFAELDQAYREGRSKKDPKQGWHRGEIGFFDYYIIPLARRWEVCCSSTGSNEDGASLVINARHNREEWIRTGQQFVESLVKTYRTN